MTVAAIVCLTASAARAEKRVALVIGNSSYTGVPALPNPKGDAGAVARLLKANGFDDVDLRTDLDFNAMRLAFRDFGGKVQGADVAVVYFAGHGLELGGENYLIPVDARLASDASVGYEAVTLSSVLATVQPAGRLKLVILDACRNNPFSQQMKIAGGATRSLTRGLGRIEPPGDVLVAYSAKAGTVAQDGAGGHSPYTEALLAHLPTPGLDIRLVMGAVRDSVVAKTKSLETPQEPFIYGSLGGQQVFLAGPQADGRSQPAPLAPPVAETPSPPPAPPGSREGSREALVPPAGAARPPGGASLWSHNGSTLYLTAEGAKRTFHYETPRPGMVQAGARPGDVVFSGTRKGREYEGFAYVFSKACGAVPYNVNGYVSADDRSVRLRGKAPIRYDDMCHPTQFRDDELVFEYAGAGR